MAKHWLIAGGGSAIAQEWIKHKRYSDVRLTLLCRENAPNEEDSSSIRIFQGIDLATEQAQVISTIAEPIDVILTCVGSFDNARLTEMGSVQWEGVLDNNLKAVFNVLKYGIPRMTNGGNIVVLGSIVGSTGGIGCANYAAAKAGLKGLVQAAANENTPKDIRINLLELGYIDLGMGRRLGKHREKIERAIPMGRFGTVGEVLDAIEFLATTTYMTGNVLTLAGGLR